MDVLIVVIIILLAIVAFFLITIVIPLLYYPKEYVRRILKLGLLKGGASIKDYEIFPYNEFMKSPPTFYFKKEQKEELVRSLFCKQPRIQNLEEFLIVNETTAFIVIQNDTILYESYFNGYSRDSLETSFSCAKSFASALIGIAIDEGFIKDVNEPITNYLPELKKRDPRFEHITIRHLLQMSSGIRYYEFPYFYNGHDAKTYYYPDLRKLALEKTKIVGKPLQKFLYNNYHPLLIGLILERATKRSVSEYLEEKIWKPIGMEFNGSWSVDFGESRFEKMESGINARSIDFAKFGRLFLNKGNWNGKQLISQKWVTESTRKDDSLNFDNFYYDDDYFANGKRYYKYFWWGFKRDENTYDFSAEGNFGQYIYICPSKNLIIVRNGKKFGIGKEEWFDVFKDFANSIDI